jgi:hypothetical protein
MYTHKFDKHNNDLNKEFWDSLHNEILKSNEDISKEELLSYVENSFVYSLFLGVCHTRN